jgi:hypothetical protein
VITEASYFLESDRLPAEPLFALLERGTLVERPHET